MDSLEIIVTKHDQGFHLDASEMSVADAVAKYGDRYLPDRSWVIIPDEKIYHQVIRDQEFVQRARNVIRSLERGVRSGSLNPRTWYVCWMRFATDGMTDLIYSGRSITPAWQINDTVSADSVSGPGSLKTHVLMNTLFTRYHMPGFGGSDENLTADHRHMARMFWEAAPVTDQTMARRILMSTAMPDEYVATCRIQEALQYPSPGGRHGAQGQLVTPPSDHYRLIYFANLVTPDGCAYMLTGGHVDVRAEPGESLHRDPHPCMADELLAERTAARQKLKHMILAEGWEQIDRDGWSFGMPKRMSAIALDKAWVVCQIEPYYVQDRERSAREPNGDYVYYHLGFSGQGIRPNLDRFIVTRCNVEMHDELYRLERGVYPMSIQHPWDLHVAEQVAAWEAVTKILLEDGWEQVNGVGKFRMPLAQSYKYPFSWEQSG
jgi:hypothetical protein